MKIRALLAALIVLGIALLPLRPSPAAKRPFLVEIEDVPGLPRVLLLGDSISEGYTVPVRVKLKGQANLHRALANCGPTEKGLANLDAWLGHGHWDVIHFNFGLHDLKYVDAKGRYADPPTGKLLTALPQYESNLRELVRRLKLTGARLIFATSTPVPSGVVGRIEGDEVRYNEVAARVMRENGVPIDDLWTFVKSRQAGIQLPHNVHFTPEGYDQTADVVVASIRRALPAPPRQ